MKKLNLFGIVGVCLYLFAPTSYAGGDKQLGALVWQKANCASCHGIDAKSPVDPSYPKLAGQHQDYLAHALTAYKRGQGNSVATANLRKNAIMGAFASQLSEKDIQNVSAYLATLPGNLSVSK